MADARLAECLRCARHTVRLVLRTCRYRTLGEGPMKSLLPILIFALVLLAVVLAPLLYSLAPALETLP